MRCGVFHDDLQSMLFSFAEFLEKKQNAEMHKLTTVLKTIGKLLIFLISQKKV